MIGTRLGSFEIIDEIGRGGMGVVYRARQLSLDRIVALKVLPVSHSGDEVAAERFEREALSMARLSHPNIVDVIEVAEQDDVRYFAMQYIEGESLEDLMRREGTLSPERAAEMAAQIADALQHAHDRGVIHRDIKPGNILIDANGRPVVTDFGIARAMDSSSLTKTGASIGTPDYMSPEVLKGNPIDGRADVYSLGVLLFQMVTGRVPFTATSPFEVANRHLNEQPPPPSSICGHLPQWLESIILRALAKQPADRFQSAAEMASVLRSGTPTTPMTQEFQPRTAYQATATEPPGPIGPAAKPAAQTTTVWALAGVGVLLILTAIGLFAGGLMGNGDGRGRIQIEDGDYVPPSSPRTVNIPAVSDMTWTHAQRRLDELGLEATRHSEHSDITPDGSVIRQYPPAGDSVAEGTVVDVYISEGPDFPVSVGSTAVYRDRDGETLNMRREPWGPVVGKLPYGARVEVLQIDAYTEPGWVKGRSLSSGTVGWMAVRNPSDSYQLLYPEQ